LQDGIKSRRKFLDGLGNQLKGLKRSTAPLQEHLALPITVEEKRKGAARLLPPPLYVTYTQLAAAREAFDDDFEVHIEGSVADAEALQRKAAAAEEEEARRREEGAAAETVAEAEYKAAGTFAGDEEETRKSKRARVSENERAVDESDPYAAHPLRVELRLGGASFTFTYLHNLHVVTANVKPREGGASANKGNRRGKGGGDETVDDDLLVNLFPGDTGADTPNIANKLRVAGFEYDRSRRDRPYRWAQHLAGLDFLAPVPVGRAPGADAETGVAKHQQQARVRNVLAALRARMASRSALK
jgi:THO complex subunit 5|tara:strand:+ start:9842 stop:10744 length:903 start_codon:yes stop_codon:yes gene_type:complete